MNARIRGLILLAAAAMLLGLPASANAHDSLLMHRADRATLKGIPSFEGAVLNTIKLGGSHGYKVEVIGIQGKHLPDAVGILASRKPFKVTYVSPDEPGPGLTAPFGVLGDVDVDFHRQKRSVEKFGKRCRFITEIGVFRGEISFNGEGGYTSAKATAAKGEILRLPNGFCGLFGDRKAARAPSTTSLVARSRTANGSLEVEASDFLVRSGFSLNASVREKVGALKITRSVSIGPRKGVLVLGSGKHPHSADLHPASPFSGSAHFNDPTDGPPTWTGSLSIAFPGVAPVALAGPSFVTRICIDQFLTRSCGVSLPPGNGQPEPEL